MMGSGEWVVRNTKKIAESKNCSDSEKSSTKKVVKRILEHRSANH